MQAAISIGKRAFFVSFFALLSDHRSSPAF
jgi:hypothetical protein